MKTQALAIIAKEPRAEGVQTKFIPEHNNEASAKLYVCFLKDIFGAGSSKGIDCFISYYPEDNKDILTKPVSNILKLKSRQSKDIGRRLQSTFAELFADGYQEIVAVSSAISQVPRGYIREAFDLLYGHDVVIGPSGDGAYHLIGLSTYREDIFEDIMWGRKTVFEETMVKIQNANLRVAVLPHWDGPGESHGLYGILRESISDRGDVDPRSSLG